MSDSSKELKVIYMGSDELALPSLQAMVDQDWLDIVAVVTQPDRPSGRKMKLRPCPVKVRAGELGLPVHDPEKIGAEESVAWLKSLEADVQTVAAYGQYIPESVLNLPPLGSINLHPSLLPLYRGASPIQSAVADGRTETGVTILYVTREMDAGDIILQIPESIRPEDTSITLKQRLADLGAQAFLQALEQIRTGTVRRTPQDEDKVMYVSKLTREDARIDWSCPAQTLRNRIRAYQPWPGAFCLLSDGETRLKIHKSRVVAGREGPPGTVQESGHTLIVACGQDALELLEVQPPGKKPMPAEAFLQGHDFRQGDLLT